MTSETDENTATKSVPIAMPNLGWLRDPVVALRMLGSGHEVALPPGYKRVTVGKSERCDVVLSDGYTSNLHCVLELREDRRVFVRDRRSKNGTFVNGNRVEAAEVTPGTVLTVGKTQLVVVGRHGRGRRTAYEQLLGEDPTFVEQVRQAVRAASSSCSVLIVGETGTGKELVARAIHDASPRSARPFVAINCGAIPPTLVESELFGHEHGAFTGATGTRDGVFVKAEGGTLFLDELGELPLEQQPHLLRVLENKAVRRVGSDEDRLIDVRLVAATNRLEGLGTPVSPLRLDLYHRIATVIIRMPPLRNRTSDIPMLVRSFMTELTGRGSHERISRSTMRALKSYPWPGNVRELRHAIERAVTLTDGELTIEDFLDRHRPSVVRLAPVEAKKKTKRHLALPLPPQAHTLPAPDLTPIHETMRELMVDALTRFGSIRRAADALGMARSTFADRARRYGIPTGPARTLR